jgi:hypothetical protein
MYGYLFYIYLMTKNAVPGTITEHKYRFKVSLIVGIHCFGRRSVYKACSLSIC